MTMELFDDLTTSELRGFQEANLPDTCDIYHATEAQDALRATVVSYPDEPDNDEPIPCRLRELTGEEVVAAQREGISATALLTVALGTDVRQNDRVVALGSTWAVDRVPPPTSWGTAQRAYLRLEEAP